MSNKNKSKNTIAKIDKTNTPIKKTINWFPIIAIAILIGLSIGIYQWQSKDSPVVQQQVQQTQSANSGNGIFIKTDKLDIMIDEASGDIHQIKLLDYHGLPLLRKDEQHQYFVQTKLLDNRNNDFLASNNIRFQADEQTYSFANTSSDKLEVVLKATTSTSDFLIKKRYVLEKGSYLIDVHLDIEPITAKDHRNGETTPMGNTTDLSLLKQYKTQYKVVRDNHKPDDQAWFISSYTGPIVYSKNIDEFQKVSFADLDKDYQSGKQEAEFERNATGGYIGMIQHHFMTAWLMHDTCQTGCAIDAIRQKDLYEVSFNQNPMYSNPSEAETISYKARLYVGPQISDTLEKIDPDLLLVKDYGLFHFLATPLFWLLNLFYTWTGNWGWAIVILVLLVKLTLLPLNVKSMRSAAQMQKLAPQIEEIKKKYNKPEQVAELQQEMVKLFQDQKVTPLGGCLPVLLQMPIFIGLYWTLSMSAELRGADWIWWITDLSIPDPYFILPLLLGVTMWFMLKGDSMQMKVIRGIQALFTIMFFFFPAGLVLYYVVGNCFTIVQQWIITKFLVD